MAGLSRAVPSGASEGERSREVPNSEGDGAALGTLGLAGSVSALEDFDPVAYINAPSWQHSRLGLHRMRELLERLGRPQDAMRFVHVAGTNGKGSTCTYIASILQESGVRTGLFTSPFIETFEERIRVDGRTISAEALLEATLRVREAAEALAAEEDGEHPTEFELMFAVALVHFRAAGCEAAVVEVGLGGRLDATNAIDVPDACVITRIGLDHTALLGDTLAEVAGEKAGIIKAGAPVITCEQEPEAAAVIAQVCEERGCALHVVRAAETALGPIDWKANPPARSFTFEGESYRTHLLGSYQPENASVALRACAVLRNAGWPVTHESCREGIAKAVWPARFEVLGGETLGARPLFIVDGAHNPQGAEALVRSLVEVRASNPAARGRVILVMSALADKDYEAMCAALAPVADAAFAFTAPNPRALSAEDLASSLRAANPDLAAVPCANAAEAVARAYEHTRPEDIIVACGSLYSVAAVKAAYADASHGFASL